MAKNPRDPRINIAFTDKEITDLKIMCVLTKRTMSAFVRLSVLEKIRSLKNKPPETP